MMPNQSRSIESAIPKSHTTNIGAFRLTPLDHFAPGIARNSHAFTYFDGVTDNLLQEEKFSQD